MTRPRRPPQHRRARDAHILSRSRSRSRGFLFFFECFGLAQL